MLTCFPFPTKELPCWLGSTNPRLTKHCRGNLAHKADGFLTHLSYYYRQDFQYHTVHWFLRPSFCPCDTPLYHTHLSEMWSKVSAVDLDPSIFLANNHWPVSCYTLFKGWLLLSLPPGCLRLVTKFVSLSQHFGALTLVCVVPLLDTELTPMPPLLSSSLLKNSEFDSIPRSFDP